MPAFISPLPAHPSHVRHQLTNLPRTGRPRYPLVTSTRSAFYRPRPRCCVEGPSPTPGDGSANYSPTGEIPTVESVKALLSSDKKADQQRGLLDLRDLPTTDALDLLLFSIRNSKNDFIVASATVALGELDLSVDDGVRDTAIATMTELLATAEDYSVRAAAAAGMGYATSVGNEPRTVMIEALRRGLLEDGEWQVQFSCLASLGVLAKGDERALDTVLPWLRSDNDLLVQAAVGALGDLGDIRALPGLLTVLGNNDMMTRQRLAQALGSIPECGSQPAAIDALRTLSKDQSFVVREAAIEALKDFGVSESRVTKDGDGMNHEDMLDLEVTNLLKGDEAGNATESASDALRRQLERSFSTEWVSGHPSLSPGSDASTVRAEYRKQQTPFPEAGMGVNDAVSRSGNRSMGSASETKDDDGTVNNDATSKDLVSDEAEYLRVVNTIRHGVEKERVLAAIELRKFRPDLARRAVYEADAMEVQTSSVRLRSVCAGILGRVGDVVGLVHTLTTDPDQNVRSACCDALVDTGGGDDAVDACIRCFQSDAHWLVRISAAIALGSIGKGMQRVEEVLINCVRHGIEDLDEVQEAVVQRHAVTALGFLGTTAAVGAFVDLLAKADVGEPVRYRVAAALSGIECTESATLAAQLARDETELVAEMAQSSLDALAKKGFSPLN